MGDIIHSMIVLYFIKKKYTNKKINKLNKKTIKKYKKNIFSQIKLVSEYKNNNYDLIIDAQGLIKSSIVARVLGKNIAGFCKNSTREGLASFFYSKKITIDYKENVIDRNAYLFSKSLDLDIKKDDILNKKPFLYYKNEDEVIYDFLDINRKNILLVVGASWKSKIYSKEKFAKIVESLNENFLIVWGNEEKKQIADFIGANS